MLSGDGNTLTLWSKMSLAFK